MKERRLVTAALPYINNVPHLGHIVGSHLPADIFARYSRLAGYETLFVGGTDEHGSTSEIAAAQIGVDLDTFGTKLHEEHKKIYDWFGISYDVFSRTVKKTHHETTREFFEVINKNGYIAKGTMRVLYSPKEKRFLPDRYVVGTCPFCGYDKANGDQCEKCTKVLDAAQLLSPKSSITGDALEVRETEHLFLKLDKLSSKLEGWIGKQKKRWRSQVSSLALGWINDGLRERCITRDLKHGVPVPLKGFEDKVFYVWFDAPIGYVSFARESSEGKGDRFWKGKDSRVYHFLGKDNIPFHTIFWPGMLLAHGKFNLPYDVVGLQFLNYEGGKFSKSQKRGVFCERLPETGVTADVFRGYLTFLIPETADTEFRWEDFQQRVNSDLVGNYGNFVNRSVSFIHSKLGGTATKGKETNADKALYKRLATSHKKITAFLEAAQLRNAFGEILALSGEANKYFNDMKPWVVINEDRERASHILYVCADIARALAVLTSPFFPGASEKVWKQLALGLHNEAGSWSNASVADKRKEYHVTAPQLLFTKITNEQLVDLKRITSEPTNVETLFNLK